MAQIRIDDEVYDKLKEAAEFSKRTVGQHILFLLDNEITFNDIRGMLAGGSNGGVPTSVPLKESVATANGDEEKNRPVKNTSDNKKIDWGKIMKQAQKEVSSGEWDRKYKEALEREKSRENSLGDLTEEDLANAKVTFEERPDAKEPEEWDSHAWPTV